MEHLIPSYEPWSKDTLVVTGAKGDFICTRNCGRLLDLNGGAYWTTILGNGDRRVRWAMFFRGFSADLFGTIHEPAEKLAEMLYARTGYDRATFSTSGSDAADTAIRMVYQYQRACGHATREKANFITLKYGFHGTTLATLTTSGFERRAEIFPTASETHVFGSWVVDPSINSDERAGEALANEEVEKNNLWPSIGAFLFEPLQGVAGIRRPVNPYCYRIIAEKCRQHGLLIIADEISTGIGRTGRFLVTEAFDPRPDIVTVGKAFSNGEFAISATLVTADVWRKLDAVSDNPLEKYLFGSCFAGHPNGCLAAIEVLKRLDDDMLEQIRAKGKRIGSLLREFKKKHEVVRDIRGVGLMWGIEFPSFEICDRVSKELIKHGVRRVGLMKGVELMSFKLCKRMYKKLFRGGIRCGVEGRVLTIFPNCYMDVDWAIGRLTSALDDIIRRM